ncbi:MULTISPECIES: AraC family transcriptional regulator [Gammaproteobacteria]|mgnify:CR=1 FL=1|uniref:AraC family transcriptional regulator n=1 Tax=Gammaproteobacteria TaxID=1236 RepID=UPI000C402C13|nr:MULTISPECIES: AraC family transcriptional regulator [Thalassolituus]MAX86199.1 AraC family transcriptional regulator [Oceanospirillaceae bacterium]MEE3161688.1 AraC family transcriptional regulator [Pseudomonadota bacterium]HCG80263.1 AraC family transcriptional regulator [Oceanospirillales bacterium]|tara:strand:- start:1153 stop:2070 length:918 start_codon:yes stop_codon:yes gene_type:complete
MSTNTSISSSDSALDNKLSGLIASLIGQKARIDTDVPGLSLHRWTEPTDPTSYMLAPSICLIGQGRKRLFLGEETFIYDAEHFLITSVELPVVTQIIEASPEKPYLGLTMELDLRLISQLMIDNQITPDKKQTDRCGIGVSRVPGNLNDAFCRLLSLASQPEDIVPLAPLIRQEIFYRLLKSDQGPRLRAITSNANHGYQIARTIEWMKENFSKPVKVEDLANNSGMSVSAFHNHFRSMTAMSPLQFQKKMRLNEARRLMLAEHLDASKAAFEVGYESPSQFSREYSRLFGAPPMKDIRQLSQTV